MPRYCKNNYNITAAGTVLLKSKGGLAMITKTLYLIRVEDAFLDDQLSENER